MRHGAALLLLTGFLTAGDDPFPDGGKVLKDQSGRISVRVPRKWSAAAVSGNVVLRGSGKYAGGHSLVVVREEGQGDPGAQRERYLRYDAGRYAGAEFKKLDEPFFGYRMNVPGQNKVVVRSFLADGEDGLVASCSSRLRNYDDIWARQVRAVVASVEVAAPAAGGTPAAPESRRVHDAKGVVSLEAPGLWKELGPEPLAGEVLVLGLGGGPVIRLLDRGDVDNGNLIITSLATEWKRTYGAAMSVRKLDGAPPRILVTNRKPGWVDYAIALTAGGRGYALVLSVRKDSFEKYRAVADAMAESAVSLAGGYRAPSSPPGDVHEEEGRYAVLHAPADQKVVLGVVGDAVREFFKLWRRDGAGFDRKANPLHLLVVATDDFSSRSDGFGAAPACYNPRTNLVVVAAPPPEKDRRGNWTGQLFFALAHAALDRDLGARCPPWLRWGLAACFEAAGRAGGRPDAAHPVYADLVVQKASAESLPTLAQVAGYTHADFLGGDAAERIAFAWAFTHAMAHGRGEPRSVFRRWLKTLEDRDEPTVPPIEAQDPGDFAEDVARHVEREWKK